MSARKEVTIEDLGKHVLHLALILDAILQMSNDVKGAASPLDAQGKLLRMQNSIQKNAARARPLIDAAKVAVADAARASGAAGEV